MKLSSSKLLLRAVLIYVRSYIYSLQHIDFFFRLKTQKKPKLLLQASLQALKKSFTFSLPWPNIAVKLMFIENKVGGRAQGKRR